jgi:hypothetical protein
MITVIYIIIIIIIIIILIITKNPRHSPLLQKFVVPRLVRKFPAVYGAHLSLAIIE